MDRASKANLKSKFHLNITEKIHNKLMTEQKMGPPVDGVLRLHGPAFCSIPIEEWDFSHDKDNK